MKQLVVGMSLMSLQIIFAQHVPEKLPVVTVVKELKSKSSPLQKVKDIHASPGKDVPRSKIEELAKRRKNKSKSCTDISSITLAPLYMRKEK